MKVCAEVGGSISGEHGIGLEKSDFMPFIFSAADLAFMQKVQARLQRLRPLQPRQGVPHQEVLRARPARWPIVRTRSKSRASRSASERGRSGSWTRLFDKLRADGRRPPRAHRRRALAVRRRGPHPRRRRLPRHDRPGGGGRPDGRRGRRGDLCRGAAAPPSTVGAPAAARRHRARPAPPGRLVEHEPGDLTATVEAGLTLAILQDCAAGARAVALARSAGRRARDRSGGVIAANASGARRHLYGTVRDLLIGLTVVTADGAHRARRRQGREERGRLRPAQALRRLLGHAGHRRGRDLQAAPAARRRAAASPSRFDRLKDCGAAARARAGRRPHPERARHRRSAPRPPTLGLAAATAALVVGFDGLREQVEWQVAEFAALVGPLGGRDVVALPPATWPRLATLARDAIASPAALMRFSVLPDARDRDDGAGRPVAPASAASASAWAAHAGVGVVTGALLAGARRRPSVATVLGEWRAIATAGGGHATLMWAPLAVKSQVPRVGRSGRGGPDHAADQGAARSRTTSSIPAASWRGSEARWRTRRRRRAAGRRRSRCTA